MNWLKQKLKKRRAKKCYIHCVKMLLSHETAFSYNGSLIELRLMDYWRNQAEIAWKNYAEL